MEKVHMWEEEHHQAGEGEEHIKLGQHQCPVLFQNDLKKNLKNDLSRFCIEPSVLHFAKRCPTWTRIVWMQPLMT
jgi:hypothetical protein